MAYHEQTLIVPHQAVISLHQGLIRVHYHVLRCARRVGWRPALAVVVCSWGTASAGTTVAATVVACATIVASAWATIVARVAVVGRTGRPVLSHHEWSAIRVRGTSP